MGAMLWRLVCASQITQDQWTGINLQQVGNCMSRQKIKQDRVLTSHSGTWAGQLGDGVSCAAVMKDTS